MSKEKQEAERLIELFGAAQFDIGDIKYNKPLAKACAAICVGQMLPLCKQLDEGVQLALKDENKTPFQDHWNKVLEHIKQL